MQSAGDMAGDVAGAEDLSELYVFNDSSVQVRSTSVWHLF
jgi:hypothetical protein